MFAPWVAGRARLQPPADDAPRPPQVGARLAAAPPGRRPKLILDHVRAEAARVLGLGPGDALDDREPLQQRGLDSLMAVELRNLLARSLDLGLPATLLFDYPTPLALARYLESLIGPSTPASAEAAGSTDVLAAIETMSDDDVDRLLDDRMGRRS